MNKLLEKHFIKTYPTIFKDMYGPVNKTCMHWGIECADGWFFLLDNLCSNVQNYVDAFNGYEESSGRKEYIKPVIAKQVKEKFGRLCFYHEGGNVFSNGMIEMACNISTRICENCGKMNETVGQVKKGWIQNLCAFCSNEYEKEIKVDRKMADLWNKVRASRKNVWRSWDTLCDIEPTKPVVLKGGGRFCKKKGKK